LFQDYLEEWLPVCFTKFGGKGFIVDFFCGPGSDQNGIKGSPKIIRSKI
jgi:hypothetical protein